jgi:hypothetical protein
MSIVEEFIAGAETFPPTIWWKFEESLDVD